MSNRTDFDNVAQEVIDYFFSQDEGDERDDLRSRIATELHDAFVAGQESNGCARCAPPESNPMIDPKARLMYAVIRHTQSLRVPELPTPGDLVCVEVPLNCTIHSADSQNFIRLISLALEIGEHWRDQEGVNGKLLDELASVTEGYRG